MTTRAPAPAPVDLFGSERAIATTRAMRQTFANASLEPALSLAYNHNLSLVFRERPDLDALYSALLNLIARHAALRSHFAADGQSLLVRERMAFELPLVDLQADTPDGREARYQQLVRQEVTQPFDLLEGPLFRAVAIDRGADGLVLLFSCHHSVVDGASLNIILGELPVLYSELVAGAAYTSLPPPDPLEQHLADAAAREADIAAHQDHWRGVFADGFPALDLPTDHPRPAQRRCGSQRIDHRIASALHERVRAAGARQGLSPFVTLLAAFALYLTRLTGQRDFVIGVPTPGQLAAGKRRWLGHDTRVVPVRCTAREGDSFDSYAQRVRGQFLSAYEHQWLGLDGIRRALDLDYDAVRGGPVAVAFGFDPGFAEHGFRYGPCLATHVYHPRVSEEFELQINAVVEHGDLLLECAFNTALFDPAQMQSRLEQFECLLAAIAATPEADVFALELLPAAQVQALEQALNQTAHRFDRELCVDQLVERCVKATPDKVAVECGDTHLTYRALWERSGGVARALVAAGVGTGAPVGVLMERSADLVAVLLGVWRAGAAYVPLDPAYPADRIGYMIEQSGMRLLLTDRAFRAGSLASPPRCLEVGTIEPAADAGFPRLPTRHAEQSAYVIYTSGSTGRPKGVQVPHRALNNFLATMREQAPGFGADDRLLAVTTLSFDIAGLELWLPLVSGATTVLADRNTSMDGARLAQALHAGRISVLQATPSTWRLLLASGWPGDPALTGLCGGEALPRELAEALLPRLRALWNVYGPTETTIWSTLDRVAPGAITIGRPIGNTQAYLLDERGARVPWGSLGELWLGGDGVALGYLGREDLTRERFVPNRFTGLGLMYRTGDLARLRPDGRIEHVGRNDFQVKVHGYRIELGEVQHALARIAGIHQCVVVVRERDPGDAHLIAYYVAQEGAAVEPAALGARLRALLPAYMVPAWFVALGQLPLTDNGKIDVKSLPDPFPARGAAAAEAAAPLAATQTMLAALPGLANVQLLYPEPARAGARPVALVPWSAAEATAGLAVRRALVGRAPEAHIPELVVRFAAHARAGRWNRSQLARRLPGGAEHPGAPLQALVAAVWSDLLGEPLPGVHDNFYALGGDPVGAVEAARRLRARTGRVVEARWFTSENLAQIAARLGPSAGVAP